jgi:hypothetical protein
LGSEDGLDENPRLEYGILGMKVSEKLLGRTAPASAGHRAVVAEDGLPQIQHRNSHCWWEFGQFAVEFDRHSSNYFGPGTISKLRGFHLKMLGILTLAS